MESGRLLDGPTSNSHHTHVQGHGCDLKPTAARPSSYGILGKNWKLNHAKNEKY